MIWFAFFLEEASVEFSRAVMRKSENLDERFVLLHQRHLEDEVHHVHLYPDLIRRVLKDCPKWLRNLNGRILKSTIREFLAPKRSGIAVIRKLAQVHPELLPRQHEFERAIRRLKNEPTFFEALFSREKLPVMNAMFNEFAEFSWYGYSETAGRPARPRT